ncbi:hypothetical protein [Pseudaminobacter soli (ex Li et al. 2025)]|uniref:DUF885 domain-containing protein n=1 Tax=Pseudaminobacter soli (ex Li et al. 2025) TaxID=1295366 RepID=A0A2P7S014_9HYPH|nr:hypothetical protein [Mesorhizobium soli]PSJ55784.1 hypothetical protein C7I85_26210 [Mesorhizobium soli]
MSTTRRNILAAIPACGLAAIVPAAASLPPVDEELFRLRDEFLRNTANLDRLNHEFWLSEVAYREELARLGKTLSDDLADGFPIAERMGAHSNEECDAAGGREIELVEAIMRTPAQSLAGLAVKAEALRIAGLRRDEAIWREDELIEMDWADEMAARFVMDVERLGRAAA